MCVCVCVCECVGVAMGECAGVVLFPTNPSLDDDLVQTGFRGQNNIITCPEGSSST